ncbi:MAG: hypothetical protein AB1486_19790 [Planctomycetota bacterium]
MSRENPEIDLFHDLSGTGIPWNHEFSAAAKTAADEENLFPLGRNEAGRDLQIETLFGYRAQLFAIDNAAPVSPAAVLECDLSSERQPREGYAARLGNATP